VTFSINRLVSILTAGMDDQQLSAAAEDLRAADDVAFGAIAAGIERHRDDRALNLGEDR